MRCKFKSSFLNIKFYYTKKRLLDFELLLFGLLVFNGFLYHLQNTCMDETGARKAKKSVVK